MHEEKATPAQYALQFNVAQLLKEATGATRHYDINVDVANEFDEDVIAVSPLTGQLRLLRTGTNILVTGLLEVTLRKNCVRCLTSLEMPVSMDIEEIFYPKIDIITGDPIDIPEDTEPANIIDEPNILNLFEIVRQEMVLANDVILYCRPDCKGLCPQCGKDQNIDPCDCETNQIDPRWAGLQALQKDED